MTQHLVTAPQQATDTPLAAFLATLDDLRHAGDVPNMFLAGRALVTLASDLDYWRPLVDLMPDDQQSASFIHAPARGPRLIMVHRPYRVMSHTHSHHVWLALAPVYGVETHQRWTPTRHDSGHAGMALQGVDHLIPGDAVTLIPPNDVHTHGHARGAVPYTLILLGDDMLRYRREEYDLDTGAWRHLPPGDAGTLNRPVTS